VKRRIWVKKVNIEGEQRADKEYYLSFTPQERLEMLQGLRERIYKLKNYENRKGLRRVYRIVKQV